MINNILGDGNECGMACGIITTDINKQGDFILLCNNFTPDMIISSKKFNGVIVKYGGRASHGFVLLKQIHIPCICLGGQHAINNYINKRAIIDSNNGRVMFYE